MVGMMVVMEMMVVVVISLLMLKPENSLCLSYRSLLWTIQLNLTLVISTRCFRYNTLLNKHY